MQLFFGSLSVVVVPKGFQCLICKVFQRWWQIIEVTTYDGVGINDGNANYGKGEYDETAGVSRTTMDCLSVKYNPATKECTVTATKNDSGKKRTLYLEAMYGDIKTMIPVIQDR